MIIQHKVAWIGSDEAVAWIRMINPDMDLKMFRVDGQGVVLEILPKTNPDITEPLRLGIHTNDLVRLGRYLLAVAAAQGQDIIRPMVGP